MRPPIQPLEWFGDELKILDQRELPARIRWIRARNAETVARAIETLAIRGAPVIGIAAAYGVALEANRVKVSSKVLLAAVNRLARTRPTGFNLFFALEAMRDLISRDDSNLALKVSRLAEKIHRDDRKACLDMAKSGSRVLKKGERILTYCNTGSLATGGIGTALGVIKHGYRKGKVGEVFACETRPVGQGARLTVWECTISGLPVTLICDNMAAALMKSGRVDRILVGADRIARNGDTSNKIGTFQLAVTARAFRIPFHVVAPTTTFDITLRSGLAIPIEERDRSEITHWIKGLDKVRNFKIWNPAFDVTPSRLISSYITEQGIIYPPFHF